MQAEAAEKILALNRQFYQTFAASFAATRQRLQPGVSRLLARLPLADRILDLGCGSGEVARALADQGHAGLYVGLDLSAELLARARLQPLGRLSASFQQADLADPDWARQLPETQFDTILAFAVLHHLPGAGLRRQVLQQVRSLLAEGGQFDHSEWQFLNSPRLRARIQPWEAVGLTATAVDAGDYLLDWRRDGYSLRYVHHFNLAELAGLAAESGFTVLETFHSDGEGGRLGLYQVWVI